MSKEHIRIGIRPSAADTAAVAFVDYSGMALKPDQPAETVEPYAAQIDCVMAMTVFPGFSGQES